MKYHNESTFSRDLHSFAYFGMTRKIHPQSECLRSASRLRRALSKGDMEKARQCCLVIQNHLKVDKETALILGIVAANDGHVSYLSTLSKRTGFSEQKQNAVLSRMFKSGLINQGNASKGFILTEKAIRMLADDTTFENSLQAEFIEILRSNADSDDPYNGVTMSDITECVEQYIHSYPESPIGQFYNENHLADLPLEEYCAFFLLCRHFVMNFTNGLKVERIIPHFKGLINRGWATMYAAKGDSDDDLIQQNNILLSASVCRKLFAGAESIIDLSTIMGQTRVLKWNEIEQKPLYYNQEETEKIQRLNKMAREDEYQRIKSTLKKHKLKVAVSGILYGGPGTGKTELVKQIARSTKRNLLLVDASKLTGSFIGESERNYRDLFRNFRYIEAISAHAPIMFIDEADGILGKRISDTGDSRDRYINTIENIILEELNDFEGILFVTTNLSSNLDDAIDRRFLMKIEFHTPDEETRRKIWKSKLPQVDDKDLSVLAREFPFSGGHIDNVATQAIIESVLNGTNITLDSLIKYGKDECSFTNKDSRKRIGF